MGGSRDCEVTDNYAKNFVRYIEIAEKVQRYREAIAGMPSMVQEDVCGRLFGYSERELRAEERRSRENLLASISEAFDDSRPGEVWADGCLFHQREFLEMSLTTLLCTPSDFTLLRCRSYKRNLRKNTRMTPRELEQEFHKECMIMAEINEKRKRGRIQPVTVMPLNMASVTS